MEINFVNMMHNIFLVPSWFLGYDILFELLFVAVTLLVSLYSFRVHSLSGEKKPKLFGIGFLFISVAYMVQMLMNSIFFFFLKDLLFTPYQAYRILIIYSASIYGYMFLSLIGLIVLVYMGFNAKSMDSLFLISILSILILIFGNQKLLLFYIMSSVIAFFIAIHFFRNHRKNSTPNSLLVLLGFVSIFFAYLFFIFSIDSHIFYFLGHFSKLIGYLLILANLLIILKLEKKFRNYLFNHEKKSKKTTN